MLRALTLASAMAALLATTALAQTPAPAQTTAQPPVSQQPPVQTDPTDPATQDADNAASTTSAMPAPGQEATPAQTTASTMAPAAASGQAFASTQQSGNVFAALQSSGQFSTLLMAVEATGLKPLLEGAGPITIFAPSDVAFNAMPQAQRMALLSQDTASRQRLQNLLLHHVVNTRVSAAQVQAAATVPSGANAPVAVNRAANPVVVGGAPVVQADVQASNGVIHVLGGVIDPAYVAPAAPTAPAAADAPTSDTPTPATTTPAEPTTPQR